MRLCKFLPLTIVLFACLTMTIACGSGSGGGSQTQPSTPIFTSSPVTTATQDVAYSYQLAATDPAGGSVTFTLTTSPSGAALSGSTVSWTPTAAESRVSNSFSVTAKTASGGTAVQSWSVTPGGTITVNWVNTYWTADGASQVPEVSSGASNLSAMWTNPDGSITVQKGSWSSAGVFVIPNVPAGFYWLQTSGGTFWTNVGTFDAGGSVAGGPLPTIANPTQTSFLFDLSGLESVPTFTPIDFTGAVSGSPGLVLLDNPSSTSITNEEVIFEDSNVDWSQISTAFLVQYVPVTIGPPNNLLNNLVLGPALTLTGLSWVDGQQNPITGTLQPSSSTSINLSVPGASEWAGLLSGVAPSTPVPFGSALLISAQLYVTQGLATSGLPVSPLVGVGSLGGSNQFLTLAGTAQQPGIAIQTEGCSGTGFATILPDAPQPAITSDVNFGTLQYGDPFPSGWARTMALCQESTVAVPIPGSSQTATFILTDSAVVAPSNTPLAPVVLPVQNATINGGSFFGSATSNSNIVALSWSAPTGLAPFGYTVRVYVQTGSGGVLTYGGTGVALSTANTSMTLPPLAGGNTYVFSITADADGSANMQTSPFRSSLPTGNATVVSGPLSISSGATMPEIHGDRRVIENFSQPVAQAAAPARGATVKHF